MGPSTSSSALTAGAEEDYKSSNQKIDVLQLYRWYRHHKQDWGHWTELWQQCHDACIQALTRALSPARVLEHGWENLGSMLQALEATVDYTTSTKPKPRRLRR